MLGHLLPLFVCRHDPALDGGFLIGLVEIETRLVELLDFKGIKVRVNHPQRQLQRVADSLVVFRVLRYR